MVTARFVGDGIDMGDAPAISSDKLSKTYTFGAFRRRRNEALIGVSFDVPKGEIFGLLGPNGAGKTTFIKLLLGITRKSAGSATVLGNPAGSIAGRRLVGYLPENLRLPKHMTALTALDYYGRLSNLSGREVRERREPLLELVGLADRAKESVRQFSKGMMQRLGLAQALLHKPSLLILDEPTDGLDPVARSQLRDILRNLREEHGTTIFLNSHILQEVELICDRVAILNRGELRFNGAVEELREQMKAGGDQIEFQLLGDESAIRSAFDDCDLTQCEQVSDKAYRVVTKLDQQAVVDRVIDRLRSARVSIYRIERKAATLEEAFLQIIDAESVPDELTPKDHPQTLAKDASNE